ncbi:uncharacterized protein VICG_00505 [Vittaforma corneae ATCC 50505]|uniref:Uncharacterized protein n=1 Tax=Vittaforma corneae (strain ATCC 50505) TaxID=993615 RepID=L2GNJ1_VITCO|nr:uncharacterized protein VICG_00505 [Vittaforma corneae ATCC 50505]ELA42406.1 hypothetical protein VICG_00505 [Vittaforma corneae ATCC 50505]
MKYKKIYSGCYRLLVARNRRFITGLIKLRQMPMQKKKTRFDEKSEESSSYEIQSIQNKPSKTRILLTRAFIRIQRQLKNIANTGCYCVNTFKDWMGYTFCYIIIKRKKMKGVLRSVKI